MAFYPKQTILTNLLLVMVLMLEISNAWADNSSFKIPLGLDKASLYIPKNNPMTKDKIALGKALFFDTRLSKDNNVSCATCHNPKLAFGDGQPVSLGINTAKGGRSAPTVINRAFSQAQFWDGRAASLEAQAIGPITNPIEMGMPSHAAVVAKLNKIDGYKKWFKKVYGSDVTLDGIAKSIAAFERTVLSGDSPFDRYMDGQKDAMSAAAVRGMNLFNGKANCIQCHSGFNFTNEQFHNIGVGWSGSNPDLGLYVVTKKKSDIGKFKTPTLREIENTGPYMHDGQLATLGQVVDFYARGGDANPFMDRAVKKLKLSQENRQDLIAFMRALSGLGWQHIAPPKNLPLSASAR